MRRDQSTFERLGSHPCDALFLGPGDRSGAGIQWIGGSAEGGSGRTWDRVAADGGVIGMPHLMRAAKREYDKIGRLASENDFGPYWNLVKAGDQ